MEHLDHIRLEHIIHDVYATPIDFAHADDSLVVCSQRMILYRPTETGSFAMATSAFRWGACNSRMNDLDCGSAHGGRTPPR